MRAMPRRRKHLKAPVPDQLLLSADPQLRNPAHRVPSGRGPSPHRAGTWALASPPPPPSLLETGMCFSCNSFQASPGEASGQGGSTYRGCCLLHPHTCRPRGRPRLRGHCWEDPRTKGLCPSLALARLHVSDTTVATAVAGERE